MASLDPELLASVEASFGDAWVLVGTDHDLPEAASWFVHEAYATSLLICRGPDDALGAFVNACTHRGTRLCTSPGRGKIQCPYHGWVFGTDGALLGASKRDGFAAFDDADYALARRPIARLGRLLFAAGRAEPPHDLATFLGPEAERLTALGLEAPPAVTSADMDAPWEEALAELPGRRIGPNLLVEDIPPLALTTVVPLDAERARRRTWAWS